MRGASGDKPAAGRRRRSQRPGFSYQVRLIGGVAARRLEREQAEAIAEALRRRCAAGSGKPCGGGQSWSTPWTPTTSGARTRTQILDKQVLLCSALPRPRPAPDVPCRAPAVPLVARSEPPVRRLPAAGGPARLLQAPTPWQPSRAGWQASP